MDNMINTIMDATNVGFSMYSTSMHISFQEDAIASVNADEDWIQILTEETQTLITIKKSDIVSVIHEENIFTLTTSDGIIFKFCVDIC